MFGKKWGLLLILVGWISMTPLWAQDCAPLPEDIISWWPAEGDASDIVGGNDGTLQDTVTFVKGQVGQAFNFDGSGFVQIANDPSLHPDEQITIEAWIRPIFSGRPTRRADADSLLSKVPFGEIRGYGLYVAMDPTPGTFFQAPSEGVPIGTAAFFLATTRGGNQIFDSSPLPNDGLYHHLAGTYDGATMRLYVDGVEVATRDVMGPITHATNNHAFIGNDANIGARNSRAAIDEVSLYGRALADDEIQAIVDAGSEGKCQPEN